MSEIEYSVGDQDNAGNATLWRHVGESVTRVYGGDADYDLAVEATGPHHADYPHYPGTLYDCHACETVCYCAEDESESVCIACTSEDLRDAQRDGA